MNTSDNLEEHSNLYVEGPITLTRHDGFGKTIYIFGDNHVIFDHPCPVEYDKAFIIHIADFLEAICNEHHIYRLPLDIFLETDMFYKTQEEFKSNYSDGLAMIFTSNILLKKYHTTPYNKYIRVHYTDLRTSCGHIPNNEYIKLYDMCEVSLFLHNLPFYIESGTVTTEIINFLNNIQLDMNNILKQLEIFEDISHLNKNINAITIPFIREDLEDRKIIARRQNFEYAKNLIETLQEYIYEVENAKNTEEYLLETILEHKYFFLKDYMDIYLLSRIFKTFKDGLDTERVIIYVGDAHADDYREQLTNWGFVQQIIQSNNNDNTCVHIPSRYLPFFT
jgi:hypothetical protein